MEVERKKPREESKQRRPCSQDWRSCCSQVVSSQGVEQGQGWRPQATTPHELGQTLQEQQGKGGFPPVGLREQAEVWGFSG